MARDSNHSSAAPGALKDLISHLSLAASAEDIGRALAKVGKHFHLTQALILDATKLSNKVGGALVFATERLEDIEAFNRRLPFASHPITVEAHASEKPFLLSELRLKLSLNEEKWWTLLPDALRKNDGIVVPVHDNDELTWCATFAGPKPDLSQTAQSVMSAAVYAGYAVFRQLLDSRAERSPLSRREAQCLGWIAEGKTDFEVGQILHISPRTVRFHISNAKAKLGVSTRIQAVAKRLERNRDD